jgi:predicted ATPase/DNA-binding CsgD family transcriptional regulator
MSSTDERTWHEDLHPREAEILDGIEAGLTNREIARQLSLSPETVKWYNKRLYAKLGVSNRTQAVAKARKLGLIGDRRGIGLSKAKTRQHNLPGQLASFVGRQTEIAQLRDLLKDARLVVLTGPGGTGKTRLALEVARELRGHYRDGAWFVELAPLEDPALIPDAIARSLRLNLLNASAREALAPMLAGRHLLLLLDNFEHLLSGAAFIGDLLAAAPQVSVLAASRERLRLYGEREFALAPLSLPEGQIRVKGRAALKYEAIQLFLERAREARPDLELDERQMEAVVEICLRLDGLPLALELAASHARIFPPSTLAQRLQDPLAGLPVGPRDAPARQRTLRKTIQWSYRLLEEHERVLFDRLSIFRGGGTLEAVEQICLTDQPSGPDEALTALVDKSLLQVRHESPGGPRFQMLETIREFARERLVKSGDLDRLRRRHAAHYAALAKRAEEEIRGRGHETWFSRLRAEAENLRSALTWSLRGEDPAYGLRLVGSLLYFWYYDGHIFEGHKWAKLALDRSAGAEPVLRAGVLRTAGNLEPHFGDLARSKHLLRQALEIYRKLDETREVAWCLAQLAGNHLEDEADLERGYAMAQESLASFRELDELPGMAYAYNVLGELARLREDYDVAEEYYRACLMAATETGETLRVPMQYGNLSYLAYHRQDFPEAVALVRKALRLFQEMDSEYGVLTTLGLLTGPLATLGEPERAARLLSASETMLAAMGAKRQVTDVPELAFYTAQIRAQLGEARFKEEWEAGARLSLQQVIDLAFSGETDE